MPDGKGTSSTPPVSTTGPTFYVMASDGTLVPATFVIGLDGKYVVNPNSTPNTTLVYNGKFNSNQYFDPITKEPAGNISDINPNNYLIGPLGSNLSYSISVGNQGASTGEEAGLSQIGSTFNGTGPGNWQRTYIDMEGGIAQAARSSVTAFQDATSFSFSLAVAAGGYGSSAWLGQALYSAASLTKTNGLFHFSYSNTSPSGILRNLKSDAGAVQYYDQNPASPGYDPPFEEDLGLPGLNYSTSSGNGTTLMAETKRMLKESIERMLPVLNKEILPVIVPLLPSHLVPDGVLSLLAPKANAPAPRSSNPLVPQPPAPTAPPPSGSWMHPHGETGPRQEVAQGPMAMPPIRINLDDIIRGVVQHMEQELTRPPTGPMSLGSGAIRPTPVHAMGGFR